MLPTREPKLDRQSKPTRLLHLPLRYRRWFLVGAVGTDRCRPAPTGADKCRPGPSGPGAARGAVPPVPRGFVGTRFAVQGYSEGSERREIRSVIPAARPCFAMMVAAMVMGCLDNRYQVGLPSMNGLLGL
jgi:hypothetical protein